MMDFDDFASDAPDKPLTSSEKAAAVLLAMGKGVAGKLLKFFSQPELQLIIKSAQTLRPIPPQELEQLVNEFEDLFTEGAGLMDNAKAMEAILEEGLTPEEVDGLLGRRAVFQGVETSVWDELQDAEPEFLVRFLLPEHPQTVAYILSMLPSEAGARVLMKLPDARRADVVNRTVNLKQVNPQVASIIEQRVYELLREMKEEKNSIGSAKVAELMNELEKSQVEELLAALEALNAKSAAKVRPKVFLFEDILSMPQRSRVLLFNDLSADIITAALRGTAADIREAVLSSIGARQRRMVEADLSTGMEGVNPKDIAVARRAVAQEAIRLYNNGQIKLKEDAPVEDATPAADGEAA